MLRAPLFAAGLLLGCQTPMPHAETSPPRQASAASEVSHDPRFDAVLSSASYPYPVSFFELESQRQKLRMAYLDVRPREPNGRAVVLLHGKNFGAFYWRTTIELLTSRGYRVIVPDQIGFGKSSKPQGYQFGFQALAENTHAILGSLGISKTHVVGHSMGGMLAARYALTFPGAVEQLVLVAPIGLEDWKRSGAKPRSVDEWYAAELKATPESLREYQKKAYYGGEWKPEYEELIRFAAGSTRHADYPQVAWCSALVYDMIWSQPVVYDLPDLKVPTLLVIGLRDRTALGAAWSPPEVAAKLGDYATLGKRAHEAIPGSRLVELPGVGHLPQVEAFSEYATALTGFLQ